jgi:hypothetical protein
LTCAGRAASVAEMRKQALIAAAGWGALALAGCQRDAPPAAETSRGASAERVAATPAPAATECGSAPGLAPSADFPTVDLAKLEANFAAAYGRACGEKLFAREPLVPAGVPHPGKLIATNAPDSNVAAIYRGGEAGRGDMVLEYHFLGSDGSRSLPTVDDLHEAIYCAVHGASEAEQDDSGRCLAD